MKRILGKQPYAAFVFLRSHGYCLARADLHNAV